MMAVARSDFRMTCLERAFELARSGRVATVTELIRLLRREGYFTDQIEGPILLRQLQDLTRAARPKN